MINDRCDTMPDHPGPLIKVKLDQLGVSKSTLAELLKLSSQTLYDVMSGKQSVTPSVALRVAKITNTSAKMWLDMQQAYDLAIAQRKGAGLLRDVPILNDRW